MNEDAFARRFYADRAELESLGIQLTVDKPGDGVAEQENYSLRPENFHLPAIAFTDAELAVAADRAVAARRRVRLRRAAAPGAAADHLGPARARCGAPEQRVDRAGHHRQRRRPRPVASAWRRSRRRSSATRRSPSTTTRWSATSGAAQGRPVPPALPGRPVLPARPLPRARRAARLPPLADPRQGRLRDEGRARLPAPHGLRPARLRQPRRVAVRRRVGTAEVWISERIAWQVERHFGRFGEVAPTRTTALVFTTAYANAAPARRPGCCASASTPRLGPAELPTRSSERVKLLAERHRGEPELAAPARGRRPAAASRPTTTTERAPRRRDPPGALRAARDARDHPHRGRPRAASALQVAELCERLQISDAGAARGRQRAERRQLRRRLLRALRRGRRRRARSRSTPSPTPTTSRAPRGCCRSRPRRSSRRST